MHSAEVQCADANIDAIARVALFTDWGPFQCRSTEGTHTHTQRHWLLVRDAHS